MNTNRMVEKIEQILKPYLTDRKLSVDNYNQLGVLLERFSEPDATIPERKDIHLYFHFPTEDASPSKLDTLSTAIANLTKKEDKMDQDIQAMIDQARKNTDAEDAGTTAITALGEKLAAAIANAGSLNATDRAALQQEVTDMQTHAAAISAAIVANTPAA